MSVFISLKSMLASFGSQLARLRVYHYLALCSVQGSPMPEVRRRLGLEDMGLEE